MDHFIYFLIGIIRLKFTNHIGSARNVAAQGVMCYRFSSPHFSITVMPTFLPMTTRLIIPASKNFFLDLSAFQFTLSVFIIQSLADDNIMNSGCSWCPFHFYCTKIRWVVNGISKNISFTGSLVIRDDFIHDDSSGRQGYLHRLTYISDVFDDASSLAVLRANKKRNP